MKSAVPSGPAGSSGPVRGLFAHFAEAAARTSAAPRASAHPLTMSGATRALGGGTAFLTRPSPLASVGDDQGRTAPLPPASSEIPSSQSTLHSVGQPPPIACVLGSRPPEGFAAVCEPLQTAELLDTVQGSLSSLDRSQNTGPTLDQEEP